MPKNGYCLFIERENAKHWKQDMKYMCRTCKKECDDIPEHMIKVHKFSKSIVESQLKSKPDCYKNSFEELK